MRQSPANSSPGGYWERTLHLVLIFSMLLREGRLKSVRESRTAGACTGLSTRHGSHVPLQTYARVQLDSARPPPLAGHSLAKRPRSSLTSSSLPPSCWMLPLVPATCAWREGPKQGAQTLWPQAQLCTPAQSGSAAGGCPAAGLTRRSEAHSSTGTETGSGSRLRG